MSLKQGLLLRAFVAHNFSSSVGDFYIIPKRTRENHHRNSYLGGIVNLLFLKKYTDIKNTD